MFFLLSQSLIFPLRTFLFLNIVHKQQYRFFSPMFDTQIRVPLLIIFTSPTQKMNPGMYLSKGTIVKDPQCTGQNTIKFTA